MASVERPDAVLFDLDGTIIDSRVPFVTSMNYALAANGHPQREPEELLPYLGPPTGIALTELVAAGDALGLEVIQEIYADRGYTETGQLIPRSQPGAMIEGAEEAAGRVLAMVEAGAVITASGKHLPTPIRSVCVHGDSTHAVATASRVRAVLEQAGVTLRPFVSNGK